MKKLVVVLFALFLVASCSNDQQSVAVKPTPVASQPSPRAQEQIHMHEYAAKGRVPAHFTIAPEVRTLPPTLSPELFTGNTKQAYRIAKEIPQTLAQLPCYCHCDRGHGHKSLLSCFEDEHGADCGICINEALMAHSLKKQGVGVGEIRKQIINAYGE